MDGTFVVAALLVCVVCGAIGYALLQERGKGETGAAQTGKGHEKGTRAERRHYRESVKQLQDNSL